jgi:hypothetical protein
MSYITNEGMNIALGKNPRADHIHKFGYSKTISGDEQTIWMGGNLYNWDAWLDGNGDEEAKILTVRSDTSAEPAKTITLQGLDADWNPYEEDVFIDRAGDTTADFVQTTGTFRRLHRAFVKSTVKNSSVTARYDAATTGDIQIYTNWTDWGNPGDLVATNFKGGNNEIFGQTQMCVFTIPEGYIGLLTSVRASCGSGKSANVQLYTRAHGSNAFLCKEIFEVSSTKAICEYDPPRVIPAKTDVELRAFRNSGSASISIAGSFDIILLKQDLASSGSLGF